MNILISGASGLIGQALTKALSADGHNVLRLVRRPAQGQDEIVRTDLTAEMLEDIDALINLSGEPVAQRWTASSKKRMQDSRVQGTMELVELLGQTSGRPKTLLNASAVGFYGDRGDQRIDEKAEAGDGFLAKLCVDWEDAAMSAAQHGIRVCTLRLGIVLAEEGGALAKMLLPFQMGLGGALGNGKQWMSWIALEDVVQAISWLLTHHELSGPFNLTAPQPVTNQEFTKTLGKTLGRPTVLPAPSFGLRLVLGEMADEMLLAGQRVEPARLLESGFAFRHPALPAAMKNSLGKPA